MIGDNITIDYSFISMKRFIIPSLWRVDKPFLTPDNPEGCLGSSRGPSHSEAGWVWQERLRLMFLAE